MPRFDAEDALSKLKGFQRTTVEHVTRRLYTDTDRGDRFLVADETGLGKSLVARGVIARAVEQLLDDPGVGRIDVVYVCSNVDIAEQNLQRLAVVGSQVPITSRLTLMAKHAHALNAAERAYGKPINLIAFTPGTSFDAGWRTGKAEERAMLHLLLSRRLQLRGRGVKSSLMLLQGGVSTLDRFRDYAEKLAAEVGGDLDRTIEGTFRTLASTEINEFQRLIEELGRKQKLPDDLRERAWELTSRLRAKLAQAGVETLEPDLIILDEFQRFRHLLSLEEGGDAAELAHALFKYENAKTLLLSATPYKPYTTRLEQQKGEDHFHDFMNVLKFLFNEEESEVDQVHTDLTGYRHALVAGDPPEEFVASLRHRLLRVMCRTERPQPDRIGGLEEHDLQADRIEADDVLGYPALLDLARSAAPTNASAAPVTVEQWKSVPYFANFIDGYLLGDHVKRKLRTNRAGDLRRILRQTHYLRRSDVLNGHLIEPGNARLRALHEHTINHDWWKLLWIPPSMPYLKPGKVYSTVSPGTVTKQLIFSSWTAIPTAIAALLSHDADRLMTSGQIDASTTRRIRLPYRVESERPAAMSTLALFWPHPELSGLGDPLHLVRQEQRQLSAAEALSRVERAIRTRINDDWIGPTTPGSTWRAYFAWPGATPPGADDVSQLAAWLSGGGTKADHEESDGLDAHIQQVFTLNVERTPAARTIQELTRALAMLALHSPGNIAYRSVSRLRISADTTTDAAAWKAAAIISDGLHSLFNRLETASLLETEYGTDDPYRLAVLRYCADGNLQAVMDEYLHLLRSENQVAQLDDEILLHIAKTARASIGARPSTYQAFDPEEPGKPLPFTSRFALRYGGRRQETESARQPEIRRAFNSPFWPFVLATTSVGQEGVDFHWWSHAVWHWNLPSNPVDLEQREGRVDRFGGHVVRKNIAAQHTTDVLAASGSDPWADAYDIAAQQETEFGEFSPYWMYPGPHRVQRQVASYPLSRDKPRLRQMHRDLGLYRLTFGQPRQEDLLAYLERQADGVPPLAAPLSLRPG